MFGARREFDKLNKKIDEYHKTVLQNHNDLTWIKRIGLLVITLLGPMVVSNSCKESDYARPNTTKERGYTHSIDASPNEYEYWK